MGYGLHGHVGLFGLGMSIIIHLAFAALVVLAVIWLFKAVFPRKCSTSITNNTGDVNAIEILKRRYAKGEIDGDEYRRLKQELEQ